MKWLITVFIAWGSLMFFPGPAGAEAGGQADTDRLLEHVEKLSTAPRIPATESEFRAVVYIEEWLRIFGYQTKLLPFSYYVYTEPKQISLQIPEIRGKTWAPRSVLFELRQERRREQFSTSVQGHNRISREPISRARSSSYVRGECQRRKKCVTQRRRGPKGSF